MKPVILLDFDRTLFDTDAFWQDFAGCLAEVTGLRQSAIANNYEDYCRGQGNDKLRYVDLDGFISEYGISFENIVSQVDKDFNLQDYLFADAAIAYGLFESHQDNFDFAVLSFGQEKFQNLKISRCNLPKDIPVYITQQAKTDFINYYLSDRHGALIDDKLGQDLPRKWTEVHINRSNKLTGPAKIGKNLYQISNLAQVPELLQKLFIDNRNRR